MTAAVLPSFVHASRPVDRPAEEVDALLRTAGATLSAEATGRALATVGPLLRGGHFRRPVTPRVGTVSPVDGPAALHVSWNHDELDRWPPATPFATRPTSRWWSTVEEETGWPTLEFDLVVEPRARGSRVAVTSTRTPGTDQSTNRVDRQLRDRIARTAVAEFLGELVALITAGSGTADVDPAEATSGRA